MFTPHTGRWLSRDPAAYSMGRDQYVYVRNDPQNFVDLSGEVPVGTQVRFSRVAAGKPQTDPQTYRICQKITSASLPCTNDDPCPCENADECNFTAFICRSVGPSPKGWIDVSLNLHSSPPKFTGWPPPRGNIIPNQHCFGDYGRSPNDDGSLTVVTNGGDTCVYTKDMFTDPGGIPIPEEIAKLPAGCRDLIAARVIGYPPFSPPPLGNFGYQLVFNSGISSLRMKFTIEIYCGCGGNSDSLGRPANRAEGTMEVEMTFP